MNLFSNKRFVLFLVKFFLIFIVLYVGTLLVIGYAAPGNRYSPFIDKYFDYVSGLKILLMKGTAVIASLFGYTTIELPNHVVRVVNGRGVMIAYDCVGYGVMSFWVAFTIASSVSFKRTIIWLTGGLLLIYLINILRIGLYLVALNKKWGMPLGFDHHTWFNVVAYTAIFTMIYFFERSNNRKLIEN